MEKAEVRTMALPVKLTQAELALRAQELASAEGVLGEAETKLDDFTEAAKGTKKTMESAVAEARYQVRKLARVVRDRQEDRDVPIMEEADYEAGAMNTYRTDTHEVVATRGLTHEERQVSLFGRERNSKKKTS